MNNHGSSNPAASYRSYGHLLKQLAKGDEQARNDYEQISKRDYTGGVLANSDPQPVWISNTLRILEQRRRITNLVSHAALPSEGETLSYPIVTEDTTTVGKQAKEGDYLPMARSRSGHEPRPSKPTAATRP